MSHRDRGYGLSVDGITDRALAVEFSMQRTKPKSQQAPAKQEPGPTRRCSLSLVKGASGRKAALMQVTVTQEGLSATSPRPQNSTALRADDR